MAKKHEEGTGRGCHSESDYILQLFPPAAHLHLAKQQEVIELLSSFRDIMRHNYETLDVDKIQDRW